MPFNNCVACTFNFAAYSDEPLSKILPRFGERETTKSMESSSMAGDLRGEVT
jgi:hypothetical protein